MNKNVYIGALFLCNLPLITHSAPWSVNSSIFAPGRLWNPGNTAITIESDNKGGEIRDTKTLNLSRNFAQNYLMQVLERCFAFLALRDRVVSQQKYLLRVEESFWLKQSCALIGYATSLSI